MRTLLLLILGAGLTLAEDRRHGQRSLQLSQAVLLTSTVADILSSRGLTERNPVLGRGDFTMRNQGAKAVGITAGLVLVQTLIVRKFPESARVLKWVNFAGAGAHGAATVYNYQIK